MDVQHSQGEVRRDGTRDTGRRSDAASPADATHAVSQGSE